MLHIISSMDDKLLDLVKDDSVRPNIPCNFRISDNAEVIVLLSDDEYCLPQAVVCVAYKSKIPCNVVELAEVSSEVNSVAVFYSIWSYVPGSGRKLIVQAQSHIRNHRRNISKFVTLSPPTDMARVFHLRNGAGILSVNSDTVNYIYD